MPSKGKAQLSFPPLVASKKWTVKSEASWPGAEFTRRSRLKTSLTETYNSDFMVEMERALGKGNFLHYQEALQPQVASQMPRGKPPSEHGNKPIQKSYVLARKEEEEGQDMAATLGSTTTSLSGKTSKTRFLDSINSQFGPAPSYLWEDREQVRGGECSSVWGGVQRPRPAHASPRATPPLQAPVPEFKSSAQLPSRPLCALQMGSMSEWFDKYGRPEPNPLKPQLYTQYVQSSRRCCGEPSQMQKMKKGSVTN